jgi:hypothetical protein
MNVVLVHLGDAVPMHLFVALDQTRVFNPDIPVHVLVSRSLHWFFLRYQPIFRYNLVCVEDLPGNFSHIDTLTGQADGSFYNMAFKRLYYMQSFLEKESLTEVIHYENDIMVYFDINQYQAAFNRYPSSAITVGTEKQAMTGFSYFKDHHALKKLLDFFDKRLSVPDLKERYGLDKIQEMALLGMYVKEMGEPDISELPSLPFGPHARRWQEFGGLFDPAAWGQYLGGIVENNCTPGWKKDTHFIGRELIQGTVDACMENQGGLSVPVAIRKDTGERIKLNSLHVHGKKLERFLSRKGVFEPEV